ncbi:hypothetical protein Lesp02_16050 [Lentzea sp. NBRC 105346]|uniref:hypothetical protein n=1 Tax=Lentzea sp. NBRC 105346 TaxID=3032205 RepID=UPI00249FE9DB|nr:hypothetical protein [Lentzea sp. NBRC 105346]GLZ29415.1 hypothetical protein Lesp02_16050 [Lentzea sp. NBRC 105346]
MDWVSRRIGSEHLDRLAELPGAELTTVLLAVMRRRVADMSAPDVLRRYRSDRFVAPASAPFKELRAAEDRLLRALPDDVEVLQLAPLAPLGTHSVMSTVDQNNVVSTIRGTDVAADPTNALALEAAVRRRAGKAVVRLAALQRVVRAQVFGGANTFAHFTLFGRVTAARDTGTLEFERRHVVEHLRSSPGDEFRLTFFDDRFRPLLDEVRSRVDRVVVEDPARELGRGYYDGFCFKVFRGGVEIGDGGLVDWTRRLLADRKERMLISGIGVDRLAVSEP